MEAKVAAQDIPCGMCLHSCVCVCSVVSDSLRPNGLYPAGSNVCGILHARMAGVGCHFLLQRIDPGIERVSPALAGKFFYL